MIVNKYSIKNQQKITVGILSQGFYTTFKWFHKFDSKKETIVKVELSSIDIEKIFQKRLFYKNGLESCSYEELYLIDILDYDIYIPKKIENRVYNHPILLKRNLTHDDLHNCIYCFKGTLKAIESLLECNKLPWTTKAMRSKEENRIIAKAKYGHTPDYYELGQALYIFKDYEVIEKIYDVEIMEHLISDFEKICSREDGFDFILDLLQARLCEFTESKDMDANTYIEDY